MNAASPCIAEMDVHRFVDGKSKANRLVVEKTDVPKFWDDLYVSSELRKDEPITHKAVRLFYALLAMQHQVSESACKESYVPFRPQLFQEVQGSLATLHLVADPIPRNLLGPNAWYHDQDDRVVSVMVPKARADIWRVGWAVADVLGVAADMSGETGDRDEQLGNLRDTSHEENSAEEYKARAKLELERYVLRQQLRKLQGTYLSEAQIEITGNEETVLPRTVIRALSLLKGYPADKELGAQVRHLLEVEAESRAMALRLQLRGADDLRNVLHRISLMYSLDFRFGYCRALS